MTSNYEVGHLNPPYVKLSIVIDKIICSTLIISCSSFFFFFVKIQLLGNFNETSYKEGMTYLL